MKKLSKDYPNKRVPSLPTKRLFGNLDARFIEKRRIQLQDFLSKIMNDPNFAGHKKTKDFLDPSILPN